MHCMHHACMMGVTVPKAIQIRDVPDEVHAVLRVRAAKAGMSMSEFLRSELITMTARPTLDELFARIEARGPTELTTEAIVDIIREQRGPLPSEP